MSAANRIPKILFFMFIIFLLSLLPACSVADEFGVGPTAESDPGQAEPGDEGGLPPGSNEPVGDSAMPVDPGSPAGEAETADIQGSDLLLKPVRFRNLGTVAYTVTPWSYKPLDPSEPASLSDASTVAFPGGSNPSAYLDLPLGTYTWCYHWELGDTNGDGMIEYAHAIDARPVTLDHNDSDDTTLAESVDLSAPTFAGELSGPCDPSANQPAALTPRPPQANGELLFLDDGSGGAEGMFGQEYMAFGYQGGQAQLTANAANYVLPAMYSGGSYANAIIELDFTGFNGGEGGQYSLIVRSDDVAGGLSFYNIIALIPARRTIEFAVWQDGWQGTQVAAIADASISLATPLHFRLEMRGNEYAVFINGTYAAGFVNDVITSAGIIGMSITTDSAPGSYSYDNLAIYALP